MVRNGLITVWVAIMMVAAGAQNVWSQPSGRSCSGPTCSGGCGVVGGCCPRRRTYGFTETHWSRWPGSRSAETRSVSEDLPKTDPPTKGEELRDREVREDRKKTSPSQPSRNSGVPRDTVGGSPISPDPRRNPDPTGNPPTGILDPATDLTPSDGSDSALPMTPSPGPVEPTEAFPTTDSTEPPTEVDPFNGLGSLTLPLPEIDLLAGAADVSLRGESPLTLHPDHSQPELLAVKSPKTSAEESSVTRATPRRKEPTTLRANRSEAVQLASVSDPISQRHNPLRLRISRDREDVKEVVEDVSLPESEIIEPIVPTVVESQQGSAKSHRKSNPLRRS